MATAASATVERKRNPALVSVAVFAAVIVAAVALYFTADVPAAGWAFAHKDHLPGLVQSVLASCRAYGQGFSALALFALMLLVDPKRRRQAMLFAIAMLVAAVVVHFAKWLPGRLRPYAYVEAMNASSSPLHLDHHLMWNLLKGLSRPRFGSFPSGHAASAFAMTGALVCMYKRGWPVFYVAAILCGLSRITDMQHYPSDVVVGSALGLWIGYGVFRWRWSNRLTESIDAGLTAPPSDEKR